MSTENARQVERLIRFWPNSNLSDEAMLAYGEAVAGKHRDDVRLAADRLISGKIERNHEFIPPPAQFAFQIKRAMEERLDEDARNRPRLAPPPPASPEEMETRKATVARLRAEGGGMLLKRTPNDFWVTPAEHEAAKARAIKEAMEAHRADIILRAADGGPAAIAEWRAQNEAEGIAARNPNAGDTSVRMTASDKG